jgi:glycosyltransferase involved in cell wall biosynthesis
MICGRPSIVTNVGGISEWVEEERSGFLTRSVSEDSLESALEKAWQQKNRWSEMGLYAHQKAMQLYDPNPGKTLLELMLN